MTKKVVVKSLLTWLEKPLTSKLIAMMRYTDEEQFLKASHYLKIRSGIFKCRLVGFVSYSWRSTKYYSDGGAIISSFCSISFGTSRSVVNCSQLTERHS